MTGYLPYDSSARLRSRLVLASRRKKTKPAAVTNPTAMGTSSSAVRTMPPTAPMPAAPPTNQAHGTRGDSFSRGVAAAALAGLMGKAGLGAAARATTGAALGDSSGGVRTMSRLRGVSALGERKARAARPAAKRADMASA